MLEQLLKGALQGFAGGQSGPSPLLQIAARCSKWWPVRRADGLIQQFNAPDLIRM